MSATEHLKNELVGVLRSEVQDLWDQEDPEFLEQLAADIAREKVLAVTSPDGTQHQQNLKHLSATLQGEIVRKKLKLNRKGNELFVRVVATVIRTVSIAALRVAKV